MEKILIIDDDGPTLTMFRLLLGAYGHTVLTAEDGAAGLELFERERPTLILTDIKMPGMDGLKVLREIKAAAPETEVVVITGHGDETLAETAREMDAAAFIHKPLNKEALDMALAAVAQRRKDKTHGGEEDPGGG